MYVRMLRFAHRRQQQQQRSRVRLIGRMPIIMYICTPLRGEPERDCDAEKRCVSSLQCLSALFFFFFFFFLPFLPSLFIAIRDLWLADGLGCWTRKEGAVPGGALGNTLLGHSACQQSTHTHTHTTATAKADGDASEKFFPLFFCWHVDTRRREEEKGKKRKEKRKKKKSREFCTG